MYSDLKLQQTLPIVFNKTHLVVHSTSVAVSLRCSLRASRMARLAWAAPRLSAPAPASSARRPAGGPRHRTTSSTRIASSSPSGRTETGSTKMTASREVSVRTTSTHCRLRATASASSRATSTRRTRTTLI